MILSARVCILRGMKDRKERQSERQRENIEKICPFMKTQCNRIAEITLILAFREGNETFLKPIQYPQVIREHLKTLQYLKLGGVSLGCEEEDCLL